MNLDTVDITFGNLKDLIKKHTQESFDRGNNYVQFQWVKNQVDPNREKLMGWDTETGFRSENSDDERTAYNRVVRQHLR